MPNAAKRAVVTGRDRTLPPGIGVWYLTDWTMTPDGGVSLFFIYKLLAGPGNG